MSADEVKEVLKAVPNGVSRKLMVGVLASSKTIKGIPNKWPNRYPRAEDIAGIFPDHPAALNLVHFNSKEPERLLDQMLEVTELGGRNFHGFQLNIKWPEVRVLGKYKKRHPDKILVLQCGSGALEAAENDPEKVAKAAWIYQEICEYLLIDPSGGFGKPFDPQKGYEYLGYLNAIVEKMSFGIAGGLSPDTLDLLETIAKVFPDTSIDAEGRLRDASDNLDVAIAREFVSRAYELFTF
jgi:hypothetical protein